jgi:hypothetical protein
MPGATGTAIYLDDTKGGSIRNTTHPTYQTNQPSYSPPTLSTVSSSPPIQAGKMTALIPTCAFPPSNGEVLIRNGVWSKKGHSIEITNGSSCNAIIKMGDAYTGALLVSFFASKASTASVINVPDRSYRIQYAFGGDLQSDCRSFVRVTSAAEFPNVETLQTRIASTEITRSRLSTHFSPSLMRMCDHGR